MRNFITNTLFSLLMLLKKSFFLLLLTLATINTSAQTFEWAKHTISTDSTARVTSLDLKTDYNGNTIVAGQFRNTVNFDTTTTFGTLTSTGLNFLTPNAFIAKYDSLGNLIWIKQFHQLSTSTSGNNMYATSIDVDEMNNIYAVITYKGQTDMDPGSGINLTPTINIFNSFILKLNENGDYIWSETYNTTSNTSYHEKIKYNNGNLFITGELTNTFDFDFSNGTDTLSPLAGSSSLFIHKIDTALNHEWVRKIDSTSLPYTEIAIDNNNDILFPISLVAGNVTINMGNNSVNLNSTGYNFGILKMTNTGNLLWAKMYNSNLHTRTITIDANNNFYTYGRLLSDTVDLDLGPSQHIVSQTNIPGNGGLSFVTKNSPNANLIWAKTFKNTINSYSIKIDNNENLYLLGDAYNGFDADPGPLTHNLSYPHYPNGFLSISFLLQLNPQGDLGWAIYHPNQIFGAFDFDKNTKYIYHSFNALNKDQYGNYIDYNFTTDSLYLSNVLRKEMVVMKIGPDTCNFLSLSIDSTYNIYCNQNGYLGAIADNGTPPYSYSWNTSPVTNNSIAYPNSNPGLFTVTVSDANNCTKDASALINGPTTQTGYDLQLNIVSNGFQTGFAHNIWVDAFNDGCTPVSGQFGIVLDTSVTYNSSTITPNYILGDTLIWDFSNITYGTHIQPILNITVDSTAFGGTPICFSTFITPDVADLDISNNYRNYCYTVVNAYDPNDKSIYPAGPCAVNYALNTEILTYTIRFQNTGNAPANNIYIIDQLDTNLDINSVNILAKSHHVIPEVLQNNTLKFRFDNIMLPDSTTDEPNSHGYVVFEVETNPNIPYGTQINNGVGIYFDYNPPVLTDTVSTIIVNSIPTVASINPSIAGAICEGDSITANIHPNFTNIIWEDGFVNNIVSSNQSNWLSLSAIDSNGCISYDSVYITVNSNPIVLATINDSIICEGDTATASVNQNFDNIVWNTGSTGISTSAQTSGWYTAIVTDLNGCSSTDSVFLTTNPLPPIYTINQSGDSLHIPYNPNFSYQWYNGGGVIVINETGYTLTPSWSGDYTVSVTDSNGCSQMSNPYTFTLLALAPELEKIAKVYPNPFVDYTYLEFSTTQNNTIVELIDINGKVLKQFVVNGDKVRIERESLPAGIYFLQTTKGNNKIIAR